MRPAPVACCIALVAATVLVAPGSHPDGAFAFSRAGFEGFAGGITGGRLHCGGSELPGGQPSGTPETGEPVHDENADSADAGHRGVTIGPGADPTGEPAEGVDSVQPDTANAGTGETDAGTGATAVSLPHERAAADVAGAYDRHYYGYHAGGEAPAVDTAVVTLPAGTEVVSVGEQPYYYGAGVFYRPSETGYTVVRAPVGARVGSIPRSSETVEGNDGTYYAFDGTYYRWVTPTAEAAGAYEAVEAPYGAMVSKLPSGAREQVVDGSKYYVYLESYYKPFYKGGDVVYLVVISPN